MCTLVPYRPRRSPSPHPSNSSSICLQAAAAVMALLLGYGLVTLPEMLLQPPASVKQSLQHFSRRLPNALSKCSHPEQKLNIQGPQTITILSPLVFSFFFPRSISIFPFVIYHYYIADIRHRRCKAATYRPVTLCLPSPPFL